MVFNFFWFQLVSGIDPLKGGLYLKPPKFEHIFAAVITSPPYFCADILLPACCLLCVL